MTKVRLLKVFHSILVLAAATSFSPQLFAQPLHQGEWKTYTAMNSITDLAVNRATGNIWVSTTGGAFRLEPTSSAKANILALRNSDGLSDNEITAVGSDSTGNIYFGGANGTIDVYSEPKHSITSIPAIALANQFVRKRIYSLSFFAPRVYIAAGFGLSIYDESQNIFSETITHFGTLPDQDTVFAASEANDSIYAVLSAGIAVAAKNAPNLSAPFAWRIVYAPNRNTLNSITVVQGKIIVGGPEGIYRIDGDSLRYISVGDSIAVVSLASSGSSLFIIDSRGNKIWTSSDRQNFSSAPLPGDNTEQNISAFALGNGDDKIFAYAIGGVVLQSGSGQVTSGLFPEGPLVNEITDLNFSGSLGKLFVSLGNVGASSFESQKSLWTGFGTNNKVLPGENYVTVFYDSIRSKLWLGTYGGGLYGLASADPAQITKYGFTEGIPSLGGDVTGFTVIGKGAIDNHGNFITTTWAGNGKGFVKTTDGNTFTATQLNPPNQSFTFGAAVQDMDDIYYIATVNNTSPPPYGVIAVSPDGTVTPIAGGTGQILNSPSVNALIVDQDNGLWCGTNVGVQVLTHSTDFTTRAPVYHARTLTFVDQQSVHAIAVDGVGNKWIGTDNGIFILNADGSSLLAHFTTSNTPLIDNTITAITVDTKNGEAYIGTHKGISRVSSIYQQGATDYSKMYVFPNPIIQQSDDAITITITGLAGGSTVKILSASGRLMRTLDGSQLGSTITWDGRDDYNKILPSGVYIAAAASPVSVNYGQTKFVVIRK